MIEIQHLTKRFGDLAAVMREAAGGIRDNNLKEKIRYSKGVVRDRPGGDGPAVRGHDRWRHRRALAPGRGHGAGQPEPATRPPIKPLLGRERLEARVARLGATELDATVPGCEYNTRFLVRGVIRHAVYRSGQIALLKKAV